MRCVSRVIHRFMRSVGIVGMTGRGIKISVDQLTIERRVGLVRAVAKLNRGIAEKNHLPKEVVLL